MNPHRFLAVSLLLCVVVLIISGCASATPATLDNTEALPETATTESVVATTEVPAEPTPTPTEPPLAALPPEPQAVSFTNSTGTTLNGYYYPAAVNPAPLVVLMHWINGDMSDWYEVAVWLQNRGQVNPFANPLDEYWWDESWFPAIPVERSYGVFIFSFSESVPFPHEPAVSNEINTTAWLDDAQSAMLKALELEGVDPTQIVTIGSVHGADGAADGCLFLNQQQPGACKGTFSLSPGSFLLQDYPETVGLLGESVPPAAVWCLGMENEIVICDMASEKGNTAFKEFPYAGYMNTGNMLLVDGLDPLPMQLILDFLEETLP